MPKPTRLPKTLNQADAQRLLRRNGWTTGKGGKHTVKMEKKGHRPITLPHHKGRDYSPGLRSAILQQAGLKGRAPEDEG